MENSSTWLFELDETVHLEEFITIFFMGVKQVCCVPLHQQLTTDDDLFGTQATDNRLKPLASIRADKE